MICKKGHNIYATKTSGAPPKNVNHLNKLC